MKVAIYGAGAMGTVLGAFISQAGESIDLISRNEAHIDQLKSEGATICGTVHFTQRVDAFLPSEMKGPYDIIFLMTKQLYNKEVVAELRHYLKDDGVICLLQNGIPEIEVANVIGEKRTYGCTLNWSANMLGPGVVELTSKNSPESLSFGLGSFHNEQTKHVKEIARYLSIMGDVTLEQNFIGVRWSKLLINSGFNGLSAIFGISLGEILANQTSRRIFLELLKECIDVAAANDVKIEQIEGIDVVKLINYNSKLKKWFVLKMLPLMMRKHKNAKSSTLQDIMKGRKTEIEAINGIVVVHGEKAGVPTPFNNRVIHLVKQLEEGKMTSSKAHIARFNDLL